MRANRGVSFWRGVGNQPRQVLGYERRSRSGSALHGGTRPRRRAADLWDVFCHCGWSATGLEACAVATEAAQAHLESVNRPAVDQARLKPGAGKPAAKVRSTTSAPQAPITTKGSRLVRTEAEARRRGISVDQLREERRRRAADDNALAAEAKRLGVKVKTLRAGRVPAAPTTPTGREAEETVIRLWAKATGRRPDPSTEPAVRLLASYDEERLRAGLRELARGDRRRTLTQWLDIVRTRR